MEVIATQELNVYLVCNGVLTSGQINLATLQVATPSAAINQNNPAPSADQGCEAMDKNGVMQVLNPV